MVLKKKKDEMEATTNQVNEETVTLMQERDWQQNEATDNILIAFLNAIV